MVLSSDTILDNRPRHTYNVGGLQSEELESEAEGKVSKILDRRVFEPESCRVVPDQVLVGSEHLNGLDMMANG